MFKKLFIILFVLIFFIPLSNYSQAALITSEAGYTGPFIDLSAYANGNTFEYTFGPVALAGAVTLTAAPTNGGVWLDEQGYGGSYIGQGFSTYLGGNGEIDDQTAYVGLNDTDGYIRFMLNAPVSSFGAMINYMPFLDYYETDFGLEKWGNPIISVLDQYGNVLESYDLAELAPIITPDGESGLNYFEYRGIARDTADIYGFQLENSFIVAKGAQGSVTPVDVPEASITGLFCLGLLGLCFGHMFVRRKRIKYYNCR